MDRVVVIGCGGVGLPFAVALASRGRAVVGVDVDAEHLRRLSAGETPLEDVGLDAALKAALAAGRLSFTTPQGLRPIDGAPSAFVVTAPTPVGADRRWQARPFDEAARLAVGLAAPGDLIVVRSTVPVGTTRALALGCGRSDLKFAAAPDRSLAGRAYEDQFATPHIVGGLDEVAADAAADLLASLGPARRVSSPEAAEALKLATNSWRDARFAIANELAFVCDAAGVDFEELRAAGADGYARFDLPRAGPVGGPCLTKDVYLLAEAATRFGVGVPLLRQAREVNEALAAHVVGWVRTAAQARSARRVAVLGLAFKGAPATRDRRGSVACEVLARLSADPACLELSSWDPADEPDAALGATAVAGAQIVVLGNDHPRLAEAGLYAACAPDALVIDLCGVAGEAIAGRPDIAVKRLGDGRPAA